MGEFLCGCGSDNCSTEFDPARGRVRTCAQCGQVSMPDMAAQQAMQIGRPPTERRPATEDDLLPPQPAFRLTPPENKAAIRAAAKAAKAQETTALKPINIIKLARRRLRELKRQINTIHKLEKERDELERLIRAADGRPVAVVATLKTAKGA